MRGTVTRLCGLIWVTSMTDRREHAVTIEALEDAQSGGRLAAVCGALVAAAPMVMPPGRRCGGCAGIGQARRRRSARHARPGPWARLRRRPRHG